MSGWTWSSGLLAGLALGSAARGWAWMAVLYGIACVFFLLAPRCFPALTLVDGTESFRRARASMRRGR